MDKPELRSIGHLAPKTESMPCRPGMTTSGSRSSFRNSETTGLSPPRRQSRGSAGSIEPRISPITAALLAGPGRSVRELLPASVMSSVAPVWAKAEHVSDDFVVTRAYKLMSMRIEAYELINTPPNRVLEAARSVLSQSLAPADFEIAKRELPLSWLGPTHKLELAADEETPMLDEFSSARST